MYQDLWNNEVKIHTRTQMCAVVMIKENCPQTSHLHNCRVQSPPPPVETHWSGLTLTRLLHRCSVMDDEAEREARPWMVNIKDSSRLQRTWSWSWS